MLPLNLRIKIKNKKRMYKIKKERIVTETVVDEIDATLAEFVGNKISTIREKKGLSQKQLVLKISEQLEGDVKLSHLINVEEGLPTVRLKVLEAICIGLGVDVYTLFSRQEA
jgi:ribosome-binding protein aMBF1 (putative translation factor)